jgi:hypothetical protein
MKKEVKNVLSRLGLIIHWAGFLLGILIIITALMNFFQEPNMLIFVLPTLFLITGIGWVIRMFLAGMVHFFPYKKIGEKGETLREVWQSSGGLILVVIALLLLVSFLRYINT